MNGAQANRPSTAASAAAGEDRDDRGGVGERPQDLPDRGRSPPDERSGPEPAVVGEPGSRRGAGVRSDDDGASHRRPAVDRARRRRVQPGRGDQLIDLAVLLEDGLEQRQPEAGLGVEGHRLGRDVLARPAQHERVEQLVRDEVAGRRVVLGPPGGGDPVAQLRVEAGPLERDVGQDRHHVDHERLALRPVERLAPGRVDQRQEVAGRLDRRRDRGRPRSPTARSRSRIPRRDGIDSAGRAR